MYADRDYLSWSIYAFLAESCVESQFNLSLMSFPLACIKLELSITMCEIPQRGLYVSLSLEQVHCLFHFNMTELFLLKVNSHGVHVVALLPEKWS